MADQAEDQQGLSSSTHLSRCFRWSRWSRHPTVEACFHRRSFGLLHDSVLFVATLAWSWRGLTISRKIAMRQEVASCDTCRLPLDGCKKGQTNYRKDKRDRFLTSENANGHVSLALSFQHSIISIDEMGHHGAAGSDPVFFNEKTLWDLHL